MKKKPLKFQNLSNFNMIPNIIEKTNAGERMYDIYSHLLKKRIIFIIGTIDDITANNIVAQLLFLESIDSKKDIFLYINSPGGIVNSGMSIYDTMQFISPDVNTICIGQACSMGAFLLSSGKFKKRFCLPNSRIMIHQPIGGYHGQASDMLIHTKEIVYTKKKINKILSINTGKPIKKIEKDTERDYFLSPKKALKYGIIDKILKSKKNKKK